MWNLFATKPTAPAVVPSDTIIPVGSFDDNPVYRDIILRVMLRFDDILDPQKLKSSLEALVVREGWRKLGARLRLNSNNKLEHHVPATFDEKRPALLYFNVKYDMEISQHDLASQLPSASAEHTVVVDADKIAPLHSAPGFPERLSDLIYSDLPQLGLYIISFDDATVVSISWSHTLCDAMGLKAIFDAWSLTLAGREDEVTPFIGYDFDPLAKFGSPESIDSYQLASRALSPLQGIVFAVRFVFDLLYHKQEEGRILCIPASRVKSLKEQAIEKITAESAEEYVSEGDVMCAYLSRYALLHYSTTSMKTVSLMNAFGVRDVLSKDILPAPGSYIGNALIPVYAFYSIKEIFELPLYQIALRIRRGMLSLGKREQLEAAAATIRKATEATGYGPVYGDATMHLLVFTNWAKARFFEVDFSAAVLRQGLNLANRTTKAGRPSCVVPHTYHPTYPLRNAFGILGKDAEGNCWIHGTLRQGLWTSVEEDLKSNKYAD